MLIVLGISDEHLECDRCGRIELKKTIVIQNTETGSINYYGSECASMIMEFDTKEINKQARKAKKESDKELAKRKAVINKNKIPAYDWAEKQPRYIAECEKREVIRSQQKELGFSEFIKQHSAILKSMEEIRQELILEYCIKHNIKTA